MDRLYQENLIDHLMNYIFFRFTRFKLHILFKEFEFNVSQTNAIFLLVRMFERTYKSILSHVNI